ncbi:gastrokine-1-like [Pezoporus flaviventris]|uniref:gastrokine-1-like n=1 Tax=Pezoporus flaviventris TaxID=889875 RepID=UPI002AAFC304|nr:gastrokine-1-like [Pezoporus flaviventris]
MKLTIVTAVLLGVLLTPTLAEDFPNPEGGNQIAVEGGYQMLNLNNERHVATIEQRSTHGSWKTIWNYENGFIATKVLPDRSCFISTMNREEFPGFDTLRSLTEENGILEGEEKPRREVTFIVKEPVEDLNSYSPDISNMCSGLTSYTAHEVRGPQDTYNEGSCTTLDVMRAVELKYCRGYDNV